MAIWSGIFSSCSLLIIESLSIICIASEIDSSFQVIRLCWNQEICIWVFGWQGRNSAFCFSWSWLSCINWTSLSTNFDIIICWVLSELWWKTLAPNSIETTSSKWAINCDRWCNLLCISSLCFNKSKINMSRNRLFKSENWSLSIICIWNTKIPNTFNICICWTISYRRWICFTENCLSIISCRWKISSSKT